MDRCKGCGAVATRYVPNNKSITLCAPCNELLWGLRTRPIAERDAKRCIGCGCITSDIVCVFCRLDMFEYLWMIGGGDKSLLDNNPFVYRLCKGHIEFAQRLYEQYPNMDRGSGVDWIRWWKRFQGWKVISFKGIQSASRDSP